MEKMTNKKALEFVLGLEEVKANSEVFAKLEKMLVQVEKKNKSATKDGKKVMTKEQKLNEEIKVVLLEVLGQYNEPKAIKELQTENEQISVTIYSNQKISALLRQLIKENLVYRVEEKRVAKFILKR